MLSNITIGRYIPQKSLIHSLDPRSKIIATILFVIAIFIPERVELYVFLTMFILIIILLTKIDIKVFINGIKAIRFLLIIMVIFNIFLIKEGEILYTLYKISIYEGALYKTFYIVVRLVLLITYSSLLTLTTTPMELTDGLESLFKPLKKIGFPAHEIAMMISIALRFIPTLLDETEKIMKAQTSRGVDFVDSKLKDKIMAIVSLLVPLFVSAFKRADELANAMEARGYKGGEGRSKYRELRWEINDSLFIIAHISIIAMILLVEKVII